MLVSLLLGSLCALQSTPSNTWANLMPRHTVPRRSFAMPNESELLELLTDRKAEMSERIDALKALAYLDVEVDYLSLKAMKRNIHHSDEALISYVRCLARCSAEARASVQKYLTHRLPAVRAEAVYGLTKYFEGGRDVARSFLSQRRLHPWQRVAAIRALAEIDLSAAQVEVMRRISAESGEVSLEFLKVLRRDLSDDHIPILIDLLKLGRSRVTVEAAAMLHHITGYSLGNDYRSWHVAYLQHKVTESPMRAKEKSDLESRTVTYTYMGIPIFSNNICFVLDSSSSMTSTMRGADLRRMTRAMKVIEEFDKMLPRLPASAKFNVVFFESIVREMYEQLTAVTADSKEYASAFVTHNNFSGGTDLYGGIERAFDLQGIEEVIVLSDGDPSVGEYTEPWQIMVELDRLNRWRNIRISSISFSAPRAAESLMYMISAYHAGHFRDID